MGSLRVKTDPAAVMNAQVLKHARVNEMVESENLYTTAAAKHLLPFALIGRWTILLPAIADPGEKDFAPVDADQLRKAGRRRWHVARLG